MPVFFLLQHSSCNFFPPLKDFVFWTLKLIEFLVFFVMPYAFPAFFIIFFTHFISSLHLSLQVMQVVNADAMVVKMNSGENKTIHLSSIRPPRIEGEVQTNLCVCVCD